MERPLVTLLLLMLGTLVCSVGTAPPFSLLDADIYNCLNSTWPRYFKADEPFDLCCRLNPRTGCAELDLSSTLNLYKESSGVQSSVSELTVVDNCTVSLQVTNTSLTDSGRYLCVGTDGQVLRHETVVIIDQPLTPQITSVICYPNKSMEVTFDRGVPSENWNDTYEVELVEHWNQGSENVTTLMCEGYLCLPGSRQCLCQYKEQRGAADMFSRPLNTPVFITVRAKRAMGMQVTENTQDFNLMEHIQPSAVSDLQATDISSKKATIKFHFGCLMDRLVAFMDLVEKPLRYHVSVYKAQGVPQLIQVEILASRYSFVPYVALQLHNLSANTDYIVAVNASGGGGMGEEVTMSFVTSKTAPLAPPQTEAYGFTRISHSYKSGLLLYWQPLPYEMWGGDNLTYTLVLTSDDGQINITRANLTNSFKLVTVPLPDVSLTARIWSENEIGSSESFSTIHIPRVTDTNVEFVVELYKNSAHVWINPTGVSQRVQSLVIHWCYVVTHTSGLDICQHHPISIETSVNPSLNYTLDLSETTHQPEMSTMSLTYIYMDDYEEMAWGRENVLANVTLYPLHGLELKPPPEPCYLFRRRREVDKMDKSGRKSLQLETTGGDENAVSSLVRGRDVTREELTSRKNQGVIPGLLGKMTQMMSHFKIVPKGDEEQDNAFGNRRFRNDKTSHKIRQKVHSRHLLHSGQDMSLPTGTEDFDVTTSSDLTLVSGAAVTSMPKIYPRFFVSVLTDNGWSGMVPASCYYDNDLGNVQLIRRVELINGQRILTFAQACDPRLPTQYRADGFIVSASSNEHCTDEEPIATIPNLVFEPMVVALPDSTKYTCVRAYRDMSKQLFSSTPFVDFAPPALMAQEGDGSRDIAVIVVPLVVSVALVLFVAGLVLFKRRRGRYECALKKEKTGQGQRGRMPFPTITADRKTIDNLSAQKNSSDTSGFLY